MIGIRVDGNSKIGTGHVMRCLAVADALAKCGQEVCFVLADDYAVKLLRNRGFSYHILGSDYACLEGELSLLCRWLQEQKPQFLLMDSYFVTEDYMEKVSALVKTAYIDDVNAFSYPVDILINYNIYGDMLPYNEKETKKDTAFLLGTSYVPLREEFCGVDYRVRKEAQNVLITTGGSDLYNLAGQLAECALLNPKTAGLQYHIVSGIFNQNYPALQQLARENSNIILHQNVSNMAELMQTCDVAMTAGGSTMYELCAVGVPMISFSFVDNQEQQIQTFVDKELVCYGGNYLLKKERMLTEAIDCLAVLTASFEQRQHYSLKEKEVVDGQGAARIARHMIQSCIK